MDSVQRLRRQAQSAGTLTVDRAAGGELRAGCAGGAGRAGADHHPPANPQVVYVPAYNPAMVYGTWPYAGLIRRWRFRRRLSMCVGNALLTGMAFGAGVGVVCVAVECRNAELGRGNVKVNVNRWNSVNVNRAEDQQRAVAGAGASGRWDARGGRRRRGRWGRRGAGGGLPPNAVGRSNVKVPSNLVQRPPARAAAPAPAQRQAAARPGAGVTGRRRRPAARPRTAGQQCRPPGAAAKAACGVQQHEPGPQRRAVRQSWPAEPPDREGGACEGAGAPGRRRRRRRAVARAAAAAMVTDEKRAGHGSLGRKAAGRSAGDAGGCRPGPPTTRPPRRPSRPWRRR